MQDSVRLQQVRSPFFGYLRIQKTATVPLGLIAAHSEISYAMFSILHGPKYIPPHEGMKRRSGKPLHIPAGLYAGVLRVHVPLKIPGMQALKLRVMILMNVLDDCNTYGEKCIIRVLNETRTWEVRRLRSGLSSNVEFHAYLDSNLIQGRNIFNLRRLLTARSWDAK